MTNVVFYIIVALVILGLFFATYCFMKTGSDYDDHNGMGDGF